MIIPALLGPLSALYICGIPGLLLPLLVGGSLAVYLTSDTTAAESGTADVAAAATSCALVAAFFATLLYMMCWRNLESYFCTFPWRLGTSPMIAPGGDRVYQTRCPFTGLRPSLRCPSCQCRVHEKGFHAQDRFISATGETILRWDAAKAATEAQEPPEQARVALDESLELRGNVFTGGVTGCCVGCATWQKCFNLAPRLALMFALTALFFAFVPWAFGSFLQLMGQGGLVVKIVCGSSSVGFAGAALLIQLRALGRANAFMSKHATGIPALRPLVRVPQTGSGGLVVRALLATPWDPLC